MHADPVTRLCLTPCMAPIGTRLYVHLAPTLDVPAYRRRWASGVEPEATPYGFHLAAELGWSVRFSRARTPRRRPWKRVLGWVDRLSGGVDLWHAWRNRASIRGADIVWTLTEQEALALAALTRVGLLPRKTVIVGTVWMLHEWDQYGPLKHRLLRWLARTWSVLTVHAEPCLEIARQELPEVPSELLHFGVSAASFPLLDPTQRDADDIVLFAMGNDRTRDWDVLLDAFGDDDRFRIVMVCRWFSDERARQYSNVTVVRDPSVERMRELYRGADYAAVPMIRNAFSGITVALEAAALGVPILGTRTGGLLTYFAEDEMILAPVGGARELREAVLEQTPDARRAMAQRAQRRFKERDYTTRGFVERYDRLTREVQASGGRQD